MKYLGSYYYYLGLKIDCNPKAKSLTISQVIYTPKAFQSMKMQDCKSVATLMAENINLVPNHEIIDTSSIKDYQSKIKILIYIMTLAYSDLTCLVSTLSKFSASFSTEYMGVL